MRIWAIAVVVLVAGCGAMDEPQDRAVPITDRIREVCDFWDDGVIRGELNAFKALRDEGYSELEVLDMVSVTNQEQCNEICLPDNRPCFIDCLNTIGPCESEIIDAVF